MAISLASGFPTSNNGAGLASLTYTVVNVGDLIVLQVRMDDTTATPSVSSISGGGVTTWTRVANSYAFTSGSNHYGYEFWYGTTTSTGSVTATITYTATPSNTCDLIAYELISGLGSSNTWGVVGGVSGNNGTSTTHTWASITSDNTHALQAYLGYDDYAAGSITGVSSGFTGYVTNYVNESLYNLSLAQNTAYAPTATDGTSGVFVTTGAIFYAAAGGSLPKGLVVAQAVNRAGTY